MTTVFVTGSGTEIGKTYVSALLVRQMRTAGYPVSALKPVVSGVQEATFETSDPGQLMAALDRPVKFDQSDAISRWRFREPLSPDMAARREGRVIPFDELVAHCVEEGSKPGNLVIEGVGGVMVPIDEQHLVIDWMIQVNEKVRLKALLVVGSYLGTISHTLSALNVLYHRDLMPAAIVVSESPTSPVPLQETVETISRFSNGVPVVGLERDTTAASAPDLLGYVTPTTAGGAT